MNDKEKLILNKLASLVGKQQKLIHKLAQQHLPGDGDLVLPDQPTPPGPAPEPPPTGAKPVQPSKTEEKTILDNLPLAIKQHLVDLTVNNGQVIVKWKTPVQDTVFNTVIKTVQTLQQKNMLPGKNYKVVESA